MSKLIMMIGLVGSGKSTYAEEIVIKENAIIHSSDKLRVEMFGDVNECDKNGELFQELYKRVRENLKLNRNVILDATNISHKRRIAVLNEFKKFNCIKECYLIATPYEKCIEQNNLRDRKVPIGVINEMYKNFYIPQYYEGWDKINIVWNTEGYDFDTHILFNGENGLNFINQDNPNHTLTIGKHCLKCSQICEELMDDFELNMAALYHDIGKRFTKQFKNSKGEDTEIAHYYQHHLVSAYDAMFYFKQEFNHDDDFILNVCNYIQWHMQPFFIETEKSKKKFIDLVGQEFYENLLILHEADKKAK